MQVRLFTNFSKERFASPLHPTAPGKDEHCQWNKVPYSFEPGQSAYLEVGVARVFAHHLISREMHAEGFDGIRGRVKDNGPDPLADKRISKDGVDKLIERCLGDVREVANEVELQMLTQALVANKVAEPESVDEVLAASEPEEPKPKKRGRKKKSAPVEEEFEGLNA